MVVLQVDLPPTCEATQEVPILLLALQLLQLLLFSNSRLVVVVVEQEEVMLCRWSRRSCGCWGWEGQG